MEPIQWVVPVKTQTGETETTDLFNVDIGFGNYLIRGLSDCKIRSASKKDAQAKAFFERPPAEQLMVGEYEDPKRFLLALSGSEKARKNLIDSKATQTLKDQINKRAVPVMYFYRNLGYRYSDPSMYPAQKNAISNENGVADVLNAEMDYSVFIIAFDITTLTRIAASVSAFIALDSPKFTVDITVGDEPAHLDAKINDPHTIDFGDMSVPSSEGRLLALQATITVSSEVIRYKHQTTVNHTYEFQEPKAIK
jgi:hypothetical protein